MQVDDVAVDFPDMPIILAHPCSRSAPLILKENATRLFQLGDEDHAAPATGA
jgi:hypothetical protein